VQNESVPEEMQRLEVPCRFLDEAVRCISEFANGLPTDLIFNLDEVGISEREDRTSTSVIVSKSMSAQKIHHKINRNLKRVPVIARISAAGESLTPYFVSSQGPPPIRENLKKRGVRFCIDFILKARSKPCINAEFFLDYIRTVFLPNLNELRPLEEFVDEDAILLMDNCPSHVADEVLGLLRDTRLRVRVIIWALTRLKYLSSLMFPFLEL
jgi:hypothetical protein